jgi:aromatic-L-amino-acid decarboxylase
MQEINLALLKMINESGKMFLSHTKVNNQIVLRMVVGQTDVTHKDVLESWEAIQEFAGHL